MAGAHYRELLVVDVEPELEHPGRLQRFRAAAREHRFGGMPDRHEDLLATDDYGGTGVVAFDEPAADDLGDDRDGAAQLLSLGSRSATSASPSR
jgi:hypothetical protein